MACRRWIKLTTNLSFAVVLRGFGAPEQVLTGDVMTSVVAKPVSNSFPPEQKLHRRSLGNHPFTLVLPPKLAQKTSSVYDDLE
jgi:hypothetical protein